MIIGRVLFNVGAILLTLFTPWWVVLVYVCIGVIVFPWYLEALFFGIYFDIMYGLPTLSWYLRVMHTIIFVLPLGAAEFVKRRINV